MADYSKEEIRKIEEKWQRIWEERQTNLVTKTTLPGRKPLR
jgi:leucyl-tRNA synthetase